MKRDRIGLVDFEPVWFWAGIPKNVPQQIIIGVIMSHCVELQRDKQRGRSELDYNAPEITQFEI